MQIDLNGDNFEIRTAFEMTKKEAMKLGRISVGYIEISAQENSDLLSQYS